MIGKMKKNIKNNKRIWLLLLLLVIGFLWLRQPAEQTNASLGESLVLLPEETAEEPEATPAPTPEPTAEPTPEPTPEPLDRHGSYDSKEEVALFLYTYGCLPDNYITKKQAEKLGWSGGSLERYAPGKCIGGSHFGNYEGLLPDGDYQECDIDTLGASSRGAKRIIWSKDGRIYYTDDHYESFTLLYGSEG